MAATKARDVRLQVVKVDDPDIAWICVRNDVLVRPNMYVT